MSVSALSVLTAWAEQKLVPPLPMRKLSRTLNGAAGAEAVTAMQQAAAENARTDLAILLSHQIPGPPSPPLVIGSSTGTVTFTGPVLIRPRVAAAPAWSPLRR